MCLAIPAQIVELFPSTDLATADVSGVQRSVHLGLLEYENITTGDWVLLHAGFAISKVNEEEARTTLELLRQLGQAYEDEMAALQEQPCDS